ncbi:MAG: histidine--tRNA ligase [candidate division WOR-3 bacterium]|nr:MAG: histidine--tRNA ligase [candidate division WOR-3 bacterium]
MYQKPKGTRDLFGKELRRLEAMNSAARSFFGRNGYEEIRTPSFEFAALFDRSIGATTDIVEHEIYKFEVSKKLYALRPEGTASVLRAFIENRIALPARFLYICSMYRRERPQKGRYREFEQIGIELLGESKPFFDAEIIDQAKRYLDLIGARDYTIELNSIGCQDCRSEYREKLREELKADIPKLCDDCRRRFEKNFLRIFDCKKETCQAVYDRVPKISDNLCTECAEHYAQVTEYLNKFGICYAENKKLVRGLDYYTRTVFEFKHGGLGAQDTIIAGGRYDLLMKELGGPDTPCTGWAMGPERLLLTIPEDLPALNAKEIFFIAGMGERFVGDIVALRNQIQDGGHVCMVGDPGESIKAQVRKANRVGAKYSIIYGEDEEREGYYTVKNMDSGEQRKIPKNDFVSFISETKGS